MGTLFLAVAPHSFPRAFAAVEYVQMGIVALLAIGAAALPRFAEVTPGLRRPPRRPRGH